MPYRENSPPQVAAQARLEELKEAYARNPKDIAVQIDLATLSIELGELDRAQMLFRKLLLQKLDGSFTSADAYFYLALIEKQRNERVRAVTMLERALEVDANHAKARDLLERLRASS